VQRLQNSTPQRNPLSPLVSAYRHFNGFESNACLPALQIRTKQFPSLLEISFLAHPFAYATFDPDLFRLREGCSRPLSRSLLLSNVSEFRAGSQFVSFLGPSPPRHFSPLRLAATPKDSDSLSALPGVGLGKSGAPPIDCALICRTPLQYLRLCPLFQRLGRECTPTLPPISGISNS